MAEVWRHTAQTALYLRLQVNHLVNSGEFGRVRRLLHVLPACTSATFVLLDNAFLLGRFRHID